MEERFKTDQVKSLIKLRKSAKILDKIYFVALIAATLKLII